MLDITIYDKKGCRHFIDHVAQITNLNDNVVIDVITDFNDQLTKTFSSNDIEYIKVTVMKGVNNE
jgi:hypothetical protein